MSTCPRDATALQRLDLPRPLQPARNLTMCGSPGAPNPWRLVFAPEDLPEDELLWARIRDPRVPGEVGRAQRRRLALSLGFTREGWTAWVPWRNPLADPGV